MIPVGLEGITAVAVAIGGCGAVIWKQGISLGRLYSTVGELAQTSEEIKKTLKDTHPVLKEDCIAYRESERDGLDRRVGLLERDFDKVLKGIEKMEMSRLEGRMKDEERWRRTEDTLLRITTLLEAGRMHTRHTDYQAVPEKVEQ